MINTRQRAVACLCQFVLISTIVPAESVDRTAKPLSQAVNDWKFRITRVEVATISDVERVQNPNLIRKWEICTELTNNTKDAWWFLASPFYGATVRGAPDQYVFLSGSRLPLQSKQHDFVEVRPGETLKAVHWVFARIEKTDGQYVLFGRFLKSPNSDTSGENFSIEWDLSTTPIGEQFSFAITLFGFYPGSARKILGEDFKRRWAGDICTQSVDLSVNLKPRKKTPIKK